MSSRRHGGVDIVGLLATGEQDSAHFYVGEAIVIEIIEVQEQHVVYDNGIAVQFNELVTKDAVSN